MLATEAYKRFLLKINKNDTNANIDVSKGEFVLLYNEQKDVWLKQQINDKESREDIQDISELSKKHVKLAKVEDSTEYTVFSLPDNFFNYNSSYSYCSSGDCSNVLIRHYPIKPKNENIILDDDNNEPSFDYEETLVDLSEFKLYVYKKDFVVGDTYLNYFREVGKIDIEGYRKIDGSPSTTIDPDLSDVYVNEILNRCAREIIIRYENPDGIQLANLRIQTEE